MRATVVDQSKREFLVKSTSAVGAVGLSLVAAPFFAQPLQRHQSTDSPPPSRPSTQAKATSTGGAVRLCGRSTACASNAKVQRPRRHCNRVICHERRNGPPSRVSQAGKE